MSAPTAQTGNRAEGRIAERKVECIDGNCTCIMQCDIVQHPTENTRVELGELARGVRSCSCIGGQSINRGHTSLHHERRSIVWLLRTGVREKWREIRNTKASQSEAADSSIPSRQLAPQPTWAYSSDRWTAYTAATHCALPAGPTAHCVHRTQRQPALLRY